MKSIVKSSLGCSLGLLALAVPALAQVPDASLFARRTAQEYRQLARYPESSRVLPPGAKDPVREKRTPTKQTTRGPQGTPILSVWASKLSVEAGRPVDLFAEPSLQGKPALPLEVTGEIASAKGIVAQVTYHDDGRAPDVKAGDGIWSARLDMPAGLEPDGAESYMVRVRARMLDGDIREAAGGFLYSNPSAHLTGRYRETTTGGNLVISAQVEVKEAGRFHLAGTLATLGGEPVGTAQAAAHLKPGLHWIDLSFYGLMFHDRKVAGPFRLSSLALATTTGMPNALNDLVENAYVTKPQHLEALTAQPFNEPKLLETARRLEGEK